MKKIWIAVIVALLALGLFAGVAAAKSLAPRVQTGTLHEYMEQALADKLNLPLATVESEFDSGKTLGQIALDHGVTQADLPAFMQEVRAAALKAAVADGVITQAQADSMLQRGGMMNGGTGYGMRNGGAGYCTGTGPQGRMMGQGGMMQRGGRWQQTNP
jgi:hypothetical protein